MDNLLVPFLFFTLTAVILLQAVERHFLTESHQREMSKMLAAIMSNNIHEYTQAVKIDKNLDEKPIESDEIELSNADDETFDKFIKRQNA